MNESGPKDGRRRREPVFNMPGVILATIAAFVVVQCYRDFALDAAGDGAFLRRFAFVPGRLTAALDIDAVAAYLTSIARQGAKLNVARYFLEDASAQYWTLLTYSVLHGDWVHLGVNALWLAAFGGPVAMRLGWLRFLLLFAVTAIAGALLYYFLHRLDFTPMVGASAAVSGIMAAAVRFVFQPGAALGPAIGAAPLPPYLAARIPAVSLAGALGDRRVIQFTLIWFAINFIFGLAAAPLGITAAAIAWEAHAGGFIAGFLLFGLFDPPPLDPWEFQQESHGRARGEEGRGL